MNVSKVRLIYDTKAIENNNIGERERERERARESERERARERQRQNYKESAFLKGIYSIYSYNNRCAQIELTLNEMKRTYISGL